MRVFIYKFLIVLVGVFIIFQLTIGLFIKEMKSTFVEYTSGDNILFLKDKLRNEIKENLEKDQILNNEDAKLLKQLLEKINKELKNSD